jgi:hypothetical protein
VIHEPMLGRPNCPEPVFMNSFAGRVIEEIGGAGFDEGDVVDDARGVGEKIGDPRAAAAVLREGRGALPRSFVPCEVSMNAKRLPAISDSGTGWPLRAARRGL